LVAETTGSGKSVGINAMILSLLYKADAADVQFARMIGTPRCWRCLCTRAFHLLAPVVTDMRQAAHGPDRFVMETPPSCQVRWVSGTGRLQTSKTDDAKAIEEHIGNPFSLTPESPRTLTGGSHRCGD
jgi:S-DNA-T family DNA segregation ATPase FtsK/SpoIIIE